MIRKLLFIILLCQLFLSGCHAQEKFLTGWNVIKTDVKTLNLRGPIKSIRTNYSVYTEEYEREYYTYRHDIYSYRFAEFNKDGLFLIVDDAKISPVVTITDSTKNIDRYDYDLEDIAVKLMHKQNFRKHHSIIDDFNMLEVNRYVSRRHGNQDDFSERIFIYSYDQTGKIIQQKRYAPQTDDYYEMLRRQKNKIKTNINELKDERDLGVVHDYSYDAKNRLILIATSTVPSGEGHLAIDYYPFATAKSNLKIHFQYDEQDRVTKQIVTIGKELENHKVMVTQNYKYHPTKGYLENVAVTFSEDIMKIRYDCTNQLVTYNEYGDIVSREFLCEINQTACGKYPSSPACSRYYDYEYDKFNNWTTCYMYLKGDRTKPTTIAKRVLEYYEN